MIAAFRLDRSRRELVMAVVALGLGTGATAGGVAAVLAGLVAVGVAAGRLRRTAVGPRDLDRWRVSNAIVLILCVAAVIVRVDALLVAVAFVGWLQVHRAWTGRGAGDDRILLLLTLLQVLLGCILTTSAWLGSLLVGFALVAPPALLACLLGAHAEARGLRAGPALARRSARGPWGLGASSLLLTVAFFVTLPRLQAGRLAGTARPEHVAGFGRDVKLGDLGEILDNPDVVMRVSVRRADGSEAPGPFYFRGVALDHFDGETWTTTLDDRSPVRFWPRLPAGTGELLYQDVVLEPMGETALFGIPEMVSTSGIDTRDGEPAVARDVNGSWYWAGEPRRIAYGVVSVVADPDEAWLRAASLGNGSGGGSRIERAALRAGAWTWLPPGLDPRVRRLAREIAAEAGPGASPYDEARAMERWLRANLSYSASPEPGESRQPLSRFLFESRRGHCEFFATALAVLLRAEGIPARVVNGFYGGEPNALGGYLVLRQNDAHSWVEAWMGEAGWVRFDATPASSPGEAVGWIGDAGDWLVGRWHRLVLDYDFDRQVALGTHALLVVGGDPRPASGFVGVSWPLLGLVPGLIGLAAVGRWLLGFLAGERRPRHRPRGRVARSLHSARRLVARRGWEIPPSLPALEAGDWLVTRAGGAGEPLRALAWLHYRVRYGGELDADLAPEARQALGRLARHLPRRLLTGPRRRGK